MISLQGWQKSVPGESELSMSRDTLDRKYCPSSWIRFLPLAYLSIHLSVYASIYHQRITPLPFSVTS